MSDRILVSTRKGLFTIVRTGGRWRVDRGDFLGDNVTLTLTDPRDGRTYVALDHGHFGVKVHRSTADGFEEIAAPAYPPKPEGHEEFDMWNRPLPWSTVRIWGLAAGGASQPGTLWCGTLPGGLFRSTDFGASWSLIRPLWDDPRRRQWGGGGADLPGLHAIIVEPVKGRDIWVAVSTGGIWRTADGGESWRLIGEGMRADHVPPEMTHQPIAQDVHWLAQCAAHPERMWVQHHNGIFVSSDGAENFTEIKSVEPSAFGFAVVAHPREADTAWFVPEVKDEKRYPAGGKLVVTRTRDSGRTFEVLSRGLPQEHAYDVVYRHALDIDSSGNWLAFGSTTGGLWISENQGDDWQMVSHTLPPVYAVRFV